MASERDEVLRQVVVSGVLPHIEASSRNLDNAMSQAEETIRLDMSNRHAMDKLRTELGWFGKVFGNESHAALVIAFVMIILGFGTAIVLWIAAYRTGQREFWSSEAHLSLAAATSALGYVFGRGSKDGSK